jgi:hypothetical protein
MAITMDLYRLERPASAPLEDAPYALGTWIPATPGGRCLECYATNKGVGPPLILGWESVPEQIPDFVWPLDGGTVAVRERVRDAFVQAAITGVEFSPIETALTAPRLIGSTPRRFVDYTGPPLWLLQPTALYQSDPERSNVRLKWRCSTCRNGFYDLPIGRGTRYVVLDRSTWHGEDIVRIDPYQSWVFCTERVKAVVEQHQFTQCDFLLEGEILPSEDAVPTRPVPPPTLVAPARFDMRPPSGRINPSPRPLLSIPPEAIPDEYEDIAKLQVKFPSLDPDSPHTCPVAWDDIIEYLAMEIPDDSIKPSDLRFVRTAQVGSDQYWLWSFVDTYGDNAYLLVSLDQDGITSVGYEAARGLSPEQYMLVNYYSHY